MITGSSLPYNDTDRIVLNYKNGMQLSLRKHEVIKVWLHPKSEDTEPWVIVKTTDEERLEIQYSDLYEEHWNLLITTFFN